MFPFIAVGCSQSEQEAGGKRDRLNAGENAEGLDVEPHVAVDDMAELMGDDALQLISLEAVDCTLRDANASVLDVQAGGEGVDAAFADEYEHGRRLDAGGDGQLFDDVEQLRLIGIIGRIRDARTAEEASDVAAAAFGQLPRLIDGCT